MATIGDPLADIGYAEIAWAFPNSFTVLPSSLTADEIVARYEALTGITVTNRAWYRAFQVMKMAVICFVAAMQFDRGVTDELRAASMGDAVAWMTGIGRTELGLDSDVDHGPVTARPERLDAVRRALG